MANIQLVTPNLSATDGTGMCLRFTQRVYQNLNPYYYNSAWDAWLNAAHKGVGNLPTDVSVPVYFEHWGTYGSPARYANWGHIVAWVPGRGYLSSPAGGHGAQWFPDIASIERAFNCRYVGWAYDVGGLTVAKAGAATPGSPSIPEAPKPKRKQKNMFVVRYKHGNPAGGTGWLVVGVQKPEVLISIEAARGVLDQLGIENSYETDKGGWLKFLRMSGMSAADIGALKVK